VAVKGYEPYFASERGTMSVNEEGYNDWTPSADGKHIRLMVKLPPAQVAAILENHMMHQPK
jgi:hypothetical protein